MIEIGVLTPDDRVELLDGLLVRKDRSARGAAPGSVGTRFATSTSLLVGLNAKLRRFGCYMRGQSPVTLPPYSEPEPDGAVVRGGGGTYRDAHPGPQDIGCVIEVADNSLELDLGWKQRIYADAGIAQYLIVNLVDDVVEEYTQPVVGRGRYAKVTPFPRGKRVELRTPDGKALAVPVRSLLP